MLSFKFIVAQNEKKQYKWIVMKKYILQDCNENRINNIFMVKIDKKVI